MTLIVSDAGIEDTTASSVFVYVPRNFDALSVMDGNLKWADAANWFLDRLYLYSNFGMRKDRHGYTPLKVAYLRKVIPQTLEKELRMRLQEAGVVECDGHYIEGQKSFGYRLTEPYQVKHKRIPIQHPLIRENILEVRKGDLTKLSKVHLHLFRQFERLTIDTTSIEIVDPERKEWVGYSHLAIELLRNKDWSPIVCEYGRFHTPLTRLMSEFRSGLRLDGQRLINLDISNSQPLLLALLFIKVLSKAKCLTVEQSIEDKELLQTIHHLGIEYIPTIGTPYTMGEVINSEGVHEDVKEYVKLVEKGELYDFLGKNSELSRKAFKEGLFRDVFFGQNRIRSKLTDEFEKQFPHVMAFIRRVKRSNYARLAWIMQREESRLMIDTICGRLMKEHPDMPVLTIHDSIMTTPGHEEAVRQTICEEFIRLGLMPTIRIEGY